MVKLSIGSLAIFTSLLAAKAVAKDVVCLVNDTPVATVDLDTGVCPFQLPAELLAFFNFNASDDYDIQFYYAIANSARYFTDIVNAGTEIEIPANQIYGTDGAPVYRVHAEDSPSSNSTEAIRKRMMNQVDVIKRDEASDFAESLKENDGTLVNSAVFKVVDIEEGSSSSAGPTETETFESTKIITITSCSDDKCTPTTVPGTPTVTTCTTDGHVTTFTTYCPITTETNTHTDVVTITHCSDDKCSETTVPGVPIVTTCTTDGTVSTLTTYCPIITVTHCKDDKCSETTVPGTPTLTTETIGGKVTEYTTYCPVSEVPGTEAPGTQAPGTQAPGTQAPGTQAPGTQAPGTQAPGTQAPGTQAPAPTPGTQAPDTQAPAPAPTTVAGETNTPPTDDAGETNTPTVAAPSVAPTSASVSTYEGSAITQGTSLFALLLVSLIHFF